MSKAMDKWKADPRVESVYLEYEDGNLYWVHLKKGFCSDPMTHTISGRSVKEIDRALRGVMRCPDKCCNTPEQLAQIPTVQAVHDESGQYSMTHPDGRVITGKKEVLRELGRLCNEQPVQIRWRWWAVNAITGVGRWVEQ